MIKDKKKLKKCRKSDLTLIEFNVKKKVNYKKKKYKKKKKIFTDRRTDRPKL